MTGTAAAAASTYTSISGIPGGCNPAHAGSCPSSYFNTTGVAQATGTGGIAIATGGNGAGGAAGNNNNNNGGGAATTTGADFAGAGVKVAGMGLMMTIGAVAVALL